MKAAATMSVAAFRLAMLALHADDTAAAQAALDMITALYPEAPLVSATASMLDTYGATGAMGATCQDVNAYLQTLNNPTGVLENSVGYGNPSLTGDGLCWGELPLPTAGSGIPVSPRP